MSREFKKMTIEVDPEEYTYWKTFCAKNNMTVKDFATKAFNKLIRDFEMNNMAKSK